MVKPKHQEKAHITLSIRFEKPLYQALLELSQKNNVPIAEATRNLLKRALATPSVAQSIGPNLLAQILNIDESVAAKLIEREGGEQTIAKAS